jgi:hypothetical protein
MLQFRRRVGIHSTGDATRGEVRACLEDDFHHFRVRIAHVKGTEPAARCFVQQPERAAQGLRIVGSIVDFSDAAKDLCATDREWLMLRDELADEVAC